MTNTNFSTLAFIGVGHMGSSLIQGLLQDGYPADFIWASDLHKEHLISLENEFKIHTTSENHVAVQKADVVIFCIKPNDMPQAFQDLKEIILKKMPLVISVAAGIHTESIRKWLGTAFPIVRAMPNTPALVRSGATGLYATGQVNESQRAIAESIMRAIGITVWLDHEAELDIVTALSGSGPAYFFHMMEILAQTAEDLGLDKKIARLLIVQTALGSARLALEHPSELSTLRQQVTSKGGTTEAAMKILQTEEFEALLKKAFYSSKDRACELGELFK